MAVVDWFTTWMRFHQRLHPNRNWVDPNSDEAVEFYEGWQDAFEENRITHDEATRLSKILQSKRPGYPERHLAAILEALPVERQKDRERAIKATLNTGHIPHEFDGTEDSRDCPECDGTGWAHRRVLYVRDGDTHGPFIVQLCCRCQRGRIRLSMRTEKDWDDDLQAHPELWDRELFHPTWFDRPARTDREFDRANLRYLKPREPSPVAPKSPVQVFGREIGIPVRRRVRGLGPLPTFVDMSPAPPPRVSSGDDIPF